MLEQEGLRDPVALPVEEDAEAMEAVVEEEEKVAREEKSAAEEAQDPLGLLEATDLLEAMVILEAVEEAARTVNQDTYSTLQSMKMDIKKHLPQITT